MGEATCRCLCTSATTPTVATKALFAAKADTYAEVGDLLPKIVENTCEEVARAPGNHARQRRQPQEHQQMQQTLLRENPQNNKRLPRLTAGSGPPSPGRATVHPRASGGLADNIPDGGDDLPEEAPVCRRDATCTDLRATAMSGNARSVQATTLHCATALAPAYMVQCDEHPDR